MDLDNEELAATRKLHGVIKDEIEVGEFIRDIYNRIGKIQRYSNGTYFTEKFGASSGEIIKHSFNIIDLIEEGDYVNGEPVEKIDVMQDEFIEITTTTEYLTNSEDIKSILTKEQYKANVYKLEEKNGFR